MDVEWDVVRIFVWHVLSLRQIEGHIKEFYGCLPKVKLNGFQKSAKLYFLRGAKIKFIECR